MGPPHTAVGDQVDAGTQTTLLSAADCDFIRKFQDSLSSEAAKGRDCGGLLTVILRRLGHFKEQIQVESARSEQDQQEPAPASLRHLLLGDNLWGPVIAEARTSGGGGEVSITGPGHEDRFQVPVTGPDDASRTVSL